MRFLFTFVGGTGHFLPTVPFARELVHRGHDVVVGCQPGMVGAVEAAGFDAVGTGGGTLLAAGERRPLVAPDRDREQQALRSTFAGRVAAERAAAVRRLARELQPDVVVRDEIDFGAAVAAEAEGLPHASVTVIAAGGFVTPDLVADPLTALRAYHGLEPDPTLAMLDRYLTLVPVPPSFRAPDHPLPRTAHHVQPATVPRSSPSPGERSTRRSVYATLGTIFHQESGDLFPRLLAALGRVDVDALLTVGREIDPAELGAPPPRVRIEQFVPAEAALATADLVVCHAGSGTVVSALAYGLPLVLLPLGADQPWNADRGEALGVARVLDPVTVSPPEIAAAIRAVLVDPAMRAAAQRIRDETAHLPGADHAADLLERLGSDGKPVLR